MPARISMGSGTSQPVLVVGSVAYDTIHTPVASGERILGGSASYAALAASYFAPTRMVGVVGHDFDPRDVERLNRRGICLEGLQRDPSGPTFFWAGRYHENWNRRETLDVQLNVFASFRPDLPDSYRGTPYVLLANIGPDLQNHVVDSLSGSSFLVADSMDLWIKIARPELERLIRRVDVLILNDSEAELFTGKSTPFQAGEILLRQGPRTLIIKKGEHGAILMHKDGIYLLPAYPVTALHDPTGAGDSFAGAFLGSLAAMGDVGFASMRKALRYATATASLTVESFSCDRLESAGPGLIESRVAELGRMTAH